MIRALATGGAATLLANLTGFLTTPIQSITAAADNSVNDFFSPILHAGDIKAENEKLKEEIRDLNKKLVNFETYKNENEYLKEYLEIKEQNAENSFEFVPSAVISRDPDDLFGSFTIDKGTLDGISQKDTVITSDGLVGMVVEAGMTYSKVMTVLDIAIDVGAKDARTKEIGIVAGSSQLANKGQTKMSHIPKSSGITKDDIIITTGVGGIFPEGLVIGKIAEVHIEDHGKSLYAVINPTADIENLRDVLVITSFLGQESEMDSLKEQPKKP